MNQLRLYSNFLVLLMAFIALGCGGNGASEEQMEDGADMVITNGEIYTMDEAQPTAEAVAVKEDKIVFVGTAAEAEKYIGANTQKIDLQGSTLTPGFIEGHAHFLGLGYHLMNLDLTKTKNYDEMIAMVKEAAEKAEPGEWITGRGWHQSKWDKMPEKMVNGFQTHEALSEVSPENPVFLKHASGHAAFANQKAMEIAGVLQLSKEGMNNQLEVEGGEIMKDENGNPTGLFNETAMSVIAKHIPPQTMETHANAMELASDECLRHGITSFHDAGSDSLGIATYYDFIEREALRTRLYIMLSSRDTALLKKWYAQGPKVGLGNNFLTVRSIKLYTDGALGSRGAWLLEPYADRPGHVGHETMPLPYIEKVSNEGLANGFQVCSHAIGDRANQEVLDIYEEAFASNPSKAKDHRFRIEHAQHLHPDDIPRFAELGVIPAMQAIHMASDRPWAIDRLGKKRIVQGAYVWSQLLDTGAKIVNGTDAPVEPIDPLASFYASVARKTLQGEPEGGYEIEQAMTREEALRSYTLDAAYGAFEEDIKGSIEVGKLADFTVFDKDIMKVPELEILEAKVLYTIVGGKVLYQQEEGLAKN